jgi:hypothetical protein
MTKQLNLLASASLVRLTTFSKLTVDPSSANTSALSAALFFSSEVDNQFI